MKQLVARNDIFLSEFITKNGKAAKLMMEEIRVVIEYGPDDLQKAYEVHYRKLYPIRSRIMIFLAVFSILLGAVFLTWSWFIGGANNWFAWFLIVYGFFLVFLYYYRWVTMGKRMFKKMPDFHKPYSYQFTPEGMLAEAEQIKTDSKWEHFINYYRTSDFIIVYPNKFRFNFFPRKYFVADEFDRLAEWISVKVKAADNNSK